MCREDAAGYNSHDEKGTADAIGHSREGAEAHSDKKHKKKKKKHKKEKKRRREDEEGQAAASGAELDEPDVAVGAGDGAGEIAGISGDVDMANRELLDEAMADDELLDDVELDAVEGRGADKEPAAKKQRADVLDSDED
jgi:hypothetical protein